MSSTLAQRIQSSAVCAVASRRGRRLVRGLARASTSYLDLANNHSYDPERNGEFQVLRALGAEDVRCILDVGANEGEWVTAAAGLLPHATFHCFEIVPATAQKLRARTEGLGAQVYVNAVGLSDEAGIVEVRTYPGFSEGASAAGFEHRGLPSELRRCKVLKGDTYCDQREIERIGLLKIDTEGLDLRVLRGFERRIVTGAVDVVQFEYGIANIFSRALLTDFYTFFEGRGYVLGKIWPREVDFRDYDPKRDENFRGPNYLAVHRARTDLIARLRPM